MPHNDDRIADLSELCIELAVEAASTAASGRSHQPTFTSATKSSATDLVTPFDQAAERFIRAQLSTQRPHDGIIGEEESDLTGTSGLTWIVDPIDGTTNFVFGLPAWGCSIAVARGDQLLAGAVHIPALSETYSATSGQGARCNGSVIAASATSSFETALIATGFSYHPQRRARQGTTVARLLPQVRDIRRSGSAAYDLCCVAAGTVDGYYEENLSLWDIAAGALIAREAGARVGIHPPELGQTLRLSPLRRTSSNYYGLLSTTEKSRETSVCTRYDLITAQYRCGNSHPKRGRRRTHSPSRQTCPRR